MTNDLKQYYLQQMGIEPWIIRRTGSSHENNLSQLAKRVSQCTACSLHQCRTRTVFARGNPQAKLMIIGEAPGFYEDQQGLPFVGKAGVLLNQMIHSIGLNEQEVYIANVLKCRPPDNRDPTVEEIALCTPYLSEQVALVAPTLLLALGRFAGQFLVKKNLPLNQLRQTRHYYNSIPCFVSYHPAYLLRSPKDKKHAYRDLLQIKQCLLD